ncbi:hypothetical protein H2201_009110 [Coniosporium apollinis]|uniref:RING-Gid-type domain-containing protein n=2 Tax=Coniosporium TaxID=2810619 RepID=A0ABQ9NJJ0_9PEZI|nr:hypothetical protein H2199_002395 [Cladosporium sp. JES 115]KAJ9653709.1 hypothetical protein H2201_009110 [Coniosporium apollinis]
METLSEEQAKLEQRGSLDKTIGDVQATMDLLMNARNSITANPDSAGKVLATLQTPVKKSFDRVKADLSEIHAALKDYGAALPKASKDKPFPTAENDALSSHPSLVNRAIAMHLLREGQFGVASTFIAEANSHPPHTAAIPDASSGLPDGIKWEQDFADGTFKSESLQRQFGEMYHILSSLRQHHDLGPAIAWARWQSAILEARGSNLEFELHRLQFVCLFLGVAPRNGQSSFSEDDGNGPLRAWQYAKTHFAPFQARYGREIQQLLGALAFHQNLSDSPYRRTFHTDSAWEDVATSFTREFCSLLGLSADSPLYIAATAGAIALPTLVKLQNIMKEKRTEWTTVHELPVPTPLPPHLIFHSIFVCPVSKEQATDANPPMMMPCGHVIAKESLDRISKGARFKCPYCPSESRPSEARKVVL